MFQTENEFKSFRKSSKTNLYAIYTVTYIPIKVQNIRYSEQVSFNKYEFKE